MLKNRIIPCLDVQNGRVVKGINFVDLQDAGDQAEQAKIKMNDSKPIFTTIIYPYIPNEKSNVSKIILITNYTLEGLIISVLFVVIFNKVSQIRKEFSKF